MTTKFLKYVEKMTKNLERMAHIDSLRGIAALLVVWAHVSETFVRLSPEVAAKGTALYDIAHDANFGRIGVLLFFAISGFVIPNSLRGEARAGAKSFLTSRFFRLFPLFWLSIPLALVFLYWLPGRAVDGTTILANVTMIPKFLGFEPLIGLYWTLALELVFYALCLGLFFFRMHNNVWMLSLCSVLFFSVFIFRIAAFDLKFFGFKIEPEVAYHSSFLGIMFWGAVYRQWYERKNIQLNTLVIVTTLIVLTPGIRTLYYQLPKGIDHISMFAITQVVPPLLFILGTTILKVRHRIMSWTGEVSYSLYILHALVFHSLFRIIKQSNIEWLMNLHLSVYLLICIALSLLVATITYRLVELPAIRFGKRIIKLKAAPVAKTEPYGVPYSV
jgi:peptidoglycan/LPS O-acetylase OafA/YrhL